MKEQVKETNQFVLLMKVVGDKINVMILREGMEAAWAPCIVVKFNEVKKQREIVRVKLKDQDQINFFLEGKLCVISNHIIQAVIWADF